MENQKNSADKTRERMLAAAERLFAQKGYDAVSVREITQAAKCNLAAVNYYFGSKKELYYDVFRHRLLPRLAENKIKFDKNLKKQTDIDLETVVRALTLVIMDKSLNNSNNENLHSLMLRELNNPTGAVDIIIDGAMLPFFRVLTDQLKKFLPENMGDIQIKLNVFSIIAMSLYFANARIPVTTITGKEYNEKFIDQLIDHIVTFALHGLQGKAKEVF